MSLFYPLFASGGNNFRKLEIMVSLSLPAVKQLLLGKGYSKQEEADLLTNIHNRAVK